MLLVKLEETGTRLSFGCLFLLFSLKVDLERHLHILPHVHRTLSRIMYNLGSTF